MINIKTDSRKVKKGDTFIAIKGNTVDGHDYIEKAIENGASKIVCEHGSYNAETIVVPDTKEYLQKYIVDNYKDIVNKLDIIGVTGTNGKTTTCFLTYQMLNKLGIKTAYIGTIGFYIENEVYELPNTTPEITEDHLDYHKTMENYLKAKLLILDYLKDTGTIIVNNDDEYCKYFEKKNYKTIGFTKSDYEVISYESTDSGTIINFKYHEKNLSITTNLRGKFNVYNYMTALAIINTYGIDIQKIFDITKDVFPPKGRCEQIKVRDAEAVIDYAHTPDAVEKIINSFLENKKGKIITFFSYNVMVIYDRNSC